MRARREAQSLAATHHFSPEGKGPGHYLFLALAIGIPLILNISAPLGALAFWVRRRSFVGAASTTPQAAPDAL